MSVILGDQTCRSTSSTRPLDDASARASSFVLSASAWSPAATPRPNVFTSASASASVCGTFSSSNGSESSSEMEWMGPARGFRNSGRDGEAVRPAALKRRDTDETDGPPLSSASLVSYRASRKRQVNMMLMLRESSRN